MWTEWKELKCDMCGIQRNNISSVFLFNVYAGHGRGARGISPSREGMLFHLLGKFHFVLMTAKEPETHLWIDSFPQ